MGRGRRDGEAAAVTLRLDPAVPWEALIARRLERLSATQRSRWLRSLLVAGFREECCLHRTLYARDARSAWPMPAGALGALTRPEKPAAAAPVVAGRARQRFASLAKVIG